MRVLCVEDDIAMAQYLGKALSEAGHLCEQVHDGGEGLKRACDRSFDVILLDRMRPVMDGLAILRSIRAEGINTPVLVLSTLGEVDDRVLGLKAGGDDYITKPFAFAELLARIEALHRRDQPEMAETCYEVGDLKLDRLSRQVSRGGEPILLQPREFKLLEYLMRHTGQVVTRTMLLENVWDYHFDPQTNVIDVHISRLRRKIDKDFDKPLLHTIRGAGYSLHEP